MYCLPGSATNLLIWSMIVLFEVLLWLPFPSVVPPVLLMRALSVTAKVLPDISVNSALAAVKHGNYSSPMPPLSLEHTSKSLI